MTEAENEKRRRDHILDMRDRATAEWEEDEARRKGLLASTTLDASADHFRGLLLEVRHYARVTMACANVDSVCAVCSELHERATRSRYE